MWAFGALLCRTSFLPHPLAAHARVRFQLVTGSTLWHCNREEQLVDERDFIELGEWTDEASEDAQQQRQCDCNALPQTKASKLRRIAIPSLTLVDLISCLLNRNPKHRPRTAGFLLPPSPPAFVHVHLPKPDDPAPRPPSAHVLAHPFISLQPQPRLLSQPATFHVFMSHAAAAEATPHIHRTPSTLSHHLYPSCRASPRSSCNT
jgi:hypothetical protein